MEEKLTLEHLAPYLPYELKVKTKYDIDELSMCNSEGAYLMYKYDLYPLSSFKPLLHPLSKLTQEIEYNGEKFVPILKVLEILKIYLVSYKLLENSIDLILDPKKHRANTRTKENRQVRFWFDNFNGIGFYCSNMRLFLYKDIYGAIKKLFEWHIDVFGLIEKGLAIEKQ